MEEGDGVDQTLNRARTSAVGALSRLGIPSIDLQPDFEWLTERLASRDLITPR